MSKRTLSQLWCALLLCCTASACFEKDGKANARTGGGPGSNNVDSARSASIPVTPDALDAYDFDHPTRVDSLPAELDEASGLTDVSPTEVGLVQDELGVIFIYDLVARRVTHRIPFGPAGDYEGLTMVDTTMFVLKSDGTLFEVRDWRRSPRVSKQALHLPTADNEGLAFDPHGRRLLIAPKSRWQRGKAGKQLRPIFSFSLETKQLDPAPALLIDIENIRSFADAHRRQVPTKETKKGHERVALKFMPACVAVHPITQNLFVISALDRTLAGFDRRGNVVGYRNLDESLYRQPEGITFLPDATLVIASEGAGKKAKLIQLASTRRPGK